MFDAATHIDLTPHCSLSVRGAVVFFGAVCLGTFGIAGVATAMAAGDLSRTITPKSEQDVLGIAFREMIATSAS